MTKKTKIPVKVLNAIEDLVGDDFASDVEWWLMKKRPFRPEDSEEMARRLGRIYIIVHSWNKRNSCYDSHKEWRESVITPSAAES